MSKCEIIRVRGGPGPGRPVPPAAAVVTMTRTVSELITRMAAASALRLSARDSESLRLTAYQKPGGVQSVVGCESRVTGRPIGGCLPPTPPGCHGHSGRGHGMVVVQP